MKTSWETYEVMKDARGFLTSKQVKTFLEGCKDDREYTLFFTLANTGRRVSELVGQRKYPKRTTKGGLFPRDIDEFRGKILWNILKKKNDYRAWVPAKTEVINKLLSYIKASNISDTQRVFPITRQRVHQLCKEISERTGLHLERMDEKGKPKPVHPHEFRHTFAINFLEALHSAEDLVKLQRILCHSSLKVTESYLRYASKDIEKTVKEMPLFE